MPSWRASARVSAEWSPVIKPRFSPSSFTRSTMPEASVEPIESSPSHSSARAPPSSSAPLFTTSPSRSTSRGPTTTCAQSSELTRAVGPGNFEYQVAEGAHEFEDETADEPWLEGGEHELAGGVSDEEDQSSSLRSSTLLPM